MTATQSPEHIPVTKTEGEGKDLMTTISESSDGYCQAELKNAECGLNKASETVECSENKVTKQVPTNVHVEAVNTDAEVIGTEGESFLESLPFAKVLGRETCIEPDCSQADETPCQAETAATNSQAPESIQKLEAVEEIHENVEREKSLDILNSFETSSAKTKTEESNLAVGEETPKAERTLNQQVEIIMNQHDFIDEKTPKTEEFMSFSKEDKKDATKADEYIDDEQTLTEIDATFGQSIEVSEHSSESTTECLNRNIKTEDTRNREEDSKLVTDTRLIEEESEEGSFIGGEKDIVVAEKSPVLGSSEKIEFEKDETMYIPHDGVNEAHISNLAANTNKLSDEEEILGPKDGAMEIHREATRNEEISGIKSKEKSQDMLASSVKIQEVTVGKGHYIQEASNLEDQVEILPRLENVEVFEAESANERADIVMESRIEGEDQTEILHQFIKHEEGIYSQYETTEDSVLDKDKKSFTVQEGQIHNIIEPTEIEGGGKEVTTVEVPKENSLQQHEPKVQTLEGSLFVSSERVETADPSDIAEIQEESTDGEGKKTTDNDHISENKIEKVKIIPHISASEDIEETIPMGEKQDEVFTSAPQEQIPEASKGFTEEEKHEVSETCEGEESTSLEHTFKDGKETIELISERQVDFKKFDFEEIHGLDNKEKSKVDTATMNTGEKIEKNEDACDTHENHTKESTIEEDTTLEVRNTGSLEDETNQQNNEVESLKEAAPESSGEDTIDKADFNVERNDIKNEQVHDGHTITITDEVDKDPSKESNTRPLSTESIKILHDSEMEASEVDGEEIKTQSKEEFNTTELVTELAENPITNSPNDAKEEQKSKEEFSEESDAAKANENIASHKHDENEIPEEVSGSFKQEQIKQEDYAISAPNEERNFTEQTTQEMSIQEEDLTNLKDISELAYGDDVKSRTDEELEKHIDEETCMPHEISTERNLFEPKYMEISKKEETREIAAEESCNFEKENDEESSNLKMEEPSENVDDVLTQKGPEGCRKADENEEQTMQEKSDTTELHVVSAENEKEETLSVVPCMNDLTKEHIIQEEHTLIETAPEVIMQETHNSSQVKEDNIMVSADEKFQKIVDEETYVAPNNSSERSTFEPQDMGIPQKEEVRELVVQSDICKVDTETVETSNLKLEETSEAIKDGLLTKKLSQEIEGIEKADLGGKQEDNATTELHSVSIENETVKEVKDFKPESEYLGNAKENSDNLPSKISPDDISKTNMGQDCEEDAKLQLDDTERDQGTALEVQSYEQVAQSNELETKNEVLEEVTESVVKQETEAIQIIKNEQIPQSEGLETKKEDLEEVTTRSTEVQQFEAVQFITQSEHPETQKEDLEEVTTESAEEQQFEAIQIIKNEQVAQSDEPETKKQVLDEVTESVKEQEYEVIQMAKSGQSTPSKEPETKEEDLQEATTEPTEEQHFEAIQIIKDEQVTQSEEPGTEKEELEDVTTEPAEQFEAIQNIKNEQVAQSKEPETQKKDIEETTTESAEEQQLEAVQFIKNEQVTQSEESEAEKEDLEEVITESTETQQFEAIQAVDEQVAQLEEIETKKEELEDVTTESKKEQQFEAIQIIKNEQVAQSEEPDTKTEDLEEVTNESAEDQRFEAIQITKNEQSIQSEEPETKKVNVVEVTTESTEEQHFEAIQVTENKISSEEIADEKEVVKGSYQVFPHEDITKEVQQNNDLKAEDFSEEKADETFETMEEETPNKLTEQKEGPDALSTKKSSELHQEENFRAKNSFDSEATERGFEIGSLKDEVSPVNDIVLDSVTVTTKENEEFSKEAGLEVKNHMENSDLTSGDMEPAMFEAKSAIDSGDIHVKSIETSNLTVNLEKETLRGAEQAEEIEKLKVYEPLKTRDEENERIVSTNQTTSGGILEEENTEPLTNLSSEQESTTIDTEKIIGENSQKGEILSKDAEILSVGQQTTDMSIQEDDHTNQKDVTQLEDVDNVMDSADKEFREHVDEEMDVPPEKRSERRILEPAVIGIPVNEKTSELVQNDTCKLDPKNVQASNLGLEETIETITDANLLKQEHEGAEKVDGSQTSKEEIEQEDNTTTEHSVSADGETVKEVRESRSVSTEILEPTDFNQEIETGNLENDEDLSGPLEALALPEKSQLDSEKPEEVNILKLEETVEQPANLYGKNETRGSESDPQQIQDVMEVASTQSGSLVVSQDQEILDLGNAEETVDYISREHSPSDVIETKISEEYSEDTNIQLENTEKARGVALKVQSPEQVAQSELPEAKKENLEEVITESTEEEKFGAIQINKNEILVEEIAQEKEMVIESHQVSPHEDNLKEVQQNDEGLSITEEEAKLNLQNTGSTTKFEEEVRDSELVSTEILEPTDFNHKIESEKLENDEDLSGQQEVSALSEATQQDSKKQGGEEDVIILKPDELEEHIKMETLKQPDKLTNEIETRDSESETRVSQKVMEVASAHTSLLDISQDEEISDLKENVNYIPSEHSPSDVIKTEISEDYSADTKLQLDNTERAHETTLKVQSHEQAAQSEEPEAKNENLEEVISETKEEQFEAIQITKNEILAEEVVQEKEMVLESHQVPPHEETMKEVQHNDGGLVNNKEEAKLNLENAGSTTKLEKEVFEMTDVSKASSELIIDKNVTEGYHSHESTEKEAPQQGSTQREEFKTVDSSVDTEMQDVETFDSPDLLSLAVQEIKESSTEGNDNEKMSKEEVSDRDIGVKDEIKIAGAKEESASETLAEKNADSDESYTIKSSSELVPKESDESISGNSFVPQVFEKEIAIESLKNEVSPGNASELASVTATTEEKESFSEEAEPGKKAQVEDLNLIPEEKDLKKIEETSNFAVEMSIQEECEREVTTSQLTFGDIEEKTTILTIPSSEQEVEASKTDEIFTEDIETLSVGQPTIEKSKQKLDSTNQKDVIELENVDNVVVNTDEKIQYRMDEETCEPAEIISERSLLEPAITAKEETNELILQNDTCKSDTKNVQASSQEFVETNEMTTDCFLTKQMSQEPEKSEEVDRRENLKEGIRQEEYATTELHSEYADNEPIKEVRDFEPVPKETLKPTDFNSEIETRKFKNNEDLSGQQEASALSEASQLESKKEKGEEKPEEVTILKSDALEENITIETIQQPDNLHKEPETGGSESRIQEDVSDTNFTVAESQKIMEVARSQTSSLDVYQDEEILYLGHAKGNDKYISSERSPSSAIETEKSKDSVEGTNLQLDNIEKADGIAQEVQSHVQVAQSEDAEIKKEDFEEVMAKSTEEKQFEAMQIAKNENLVEEITEEKEVLREAHQVFPHEEIMKKVQQNDDLKAEETVMQLSEDTGKARTRDYIGEESTQEERVVGDHHLAYFEDRTNKDYVFIEDERLGIKEEEAKLNLENKGSMTKLEEVPFSGIVLEKNEQDASGTKDSKETLTTNDEKRPQSDLGLPTAKIPAEEEITNVKAGDSIKEAYEVRPKDTGNEFGKIYEEDKELSTKVADNLEKYPHTGKDENTSLTSGDGKCTVKEGVDVKCQDPCANQLGASIINERYPNEEPDKNSENTEQKHKIALEAQMETEISKPAAYKNIEDETRHNKDEEQIQFSATEREGKLDQLETNVNEDTADKSSLETAKNELSNLIQESTEETLQTAGNLSGKEHIQTEEAKQKDFKDEEEEGEEHKREDSGSDGPVLVEASRDMEAIKVSPHKKSHNILSGVGSKVKHSISKVKKAITGKSSHPKPTSPK